MMAQVSESYWLAKVRELESALVFEKAKGLVLKSELESALVIKSELELELVRLKVKLKELELTQE